MLVFQGKLYAANYFLGFISVINQKTLGVTQLMTTGLLPNQLLGWKKNTFLVIDKASSITELPSGMAKMPLPPWVATTSTRSPSTDLTGAGLPG